MDRKSFIKSIAVLPFLGIAAAKAKVAEVVDEAIENKDVNGEIETVDGNWTINTSGWGSSSLYMYGSSSSSLFVTTTGAGVTTYVDSAYVSGDIQTKGEL